MFLFSCLLHRNLINSLAFGKSYFLYLRFASLDTLCLNTSRCCLFWNPICFHWKTKRISYPLLFSYLYSFFIGTQVSCRTRYFEFSTDLSCIFRGLSQSSLAHSCISFLILAHLLSNELNSGPRAQYYLRIYCIFDSRLETREFLSSDHRFHGGSFNLRQAQMWTWTKKLLAS